MSLAFAGFAIGLSNNDANVSNKIKAKMVDGTPIEICVYDEPLSNDGFVINVHRPDDPPGQCWGTIIYPKKVEINE